MEINALDYKITDSIFLQFQKIKETDYRPIIANNQNLHKIPLIVSEGDIPKIKDLLDSITFKDYPLLYIANIVAGSILIITKYKSRK